MIVLDSVACLNQFACLCRLADLRPQFLVDFKSIRSITVFSQIKINRHICTYSSCIYDEMF